MTRAAVSDTNDIPLRQNTPAILDCQVAAKVLYRRAERLFHLQFVVGVVVPVLIAITNLLLPRLPLTANLSRTSIAAWGALYGLVIMLLDELVFDDWQQRWKRCAATAQEMFDTALFELPWRTAKVGSPLEFSDVHTWAKKWRRTDPSLSEARDWYAPIVGCAPLHLARVLCQRTNLWWDSKLRRHYGLILGAFATLLAIFTLTVVKYLGLDVDGFLLAVSTLAPAFRWAIRERKRQLAAATTLDRLCTRARDLHDEIIADSVHPVDALRQSRELQDDIFDHRRSVPIGISWLYGILRSNFEVGMRVDAERSVHEFRKQRGLPPCEGAVRGP